MKLLLLVQNETDVAHLEGAARAILNSSITGLWIVFSPAITVNAFEASTKLDAEIQQLRQAEQQAATRTDYEAAKGYKVQREGKELDRAKVLRDAWKSASPEDRKSKSQAAFKPLIDLLQPKGLNIQITAHPDHYDREQWIAMLNSMTGIWFKPFTPGSFVVAWPESVETSIKQLEMKEHTLNRLPVVPATGKPIAPVGNDGEPINPRRKQLEDMHGMKRRSLANSFGIDLQGKEVPQLIDEILAAEAKGKPEPALAEY